MLKDFKEFVMRGNVVDMAVGIIIGAAFGVIVTSLVSDIIMPPIGLVLGDDFSNLFAVIQEGNPIGPYATLADAKAAGAVTINWGVFVLAIISFIIIAIAVFLLIRYINKMRREAEEAPPDTKDCPYCLSKIAIEAKRCPYCTSEL
jgi:large conductance mechanosensitive channel